MNNSRAIAQMVRELKTARQRVEIGIATDRDREAIRVIGGKIDEFNSDQRIIQAGIEAQRILERSGVEFTHDYSKGKFTVYKGQKKKFMVREELILLVLRAHHRLNLTQHDINKTIDRVRYWAPQSEIARIALKYTQDKVAA